MRAEAPSARECACAVRHVGIQHGKNCHSLGGASCKLTVGCCNVCVCVCVVHIITIVSICHDNNAYNIWTTLVDNGQSPQLLSLY